MKTTSQKKLFLIPLKFGGKPFLGLAQLSKIFFQLCCVGRWVPLRDHFPIKLLFFKSWYKFTQNHLK
jgi:hypothetical protein